MWENEEFNIEYKPKTSKSDIEHYTLHIPYDIFDSSELSDDGNFRMYIYKDELKRLYKLISNEMEA